ncbi:MAG: YceD family protein [Flavobacteriaceae bacterium]
MMMNQAYSIPFAGLKLGKHEIKYIIDNTFFEEFEYSEFNNAQIGLVVVLERMSTMLELEMKASGTINLDCDLTSEPYDQEIKSSLDLVVKFGEEYNDEDDEILVIPHGEHQINIAQYIYEMLVLAVPPKRIHPGVLDGTLQSDVLKKLEELRPKESKRRTEQTDPRWDVLKDLKTDN